MGVRSTKRRRMKREVKLDERRRDLEEERELRGEEERSPFFPYPIYATLRDIQLTFIPRRSEEEEEEEFRRAREIPI